jgi:hypothetical protein
MGWNKRNNRNNMYGTKKTFQQFIYRPENGLPLWNYVIMRAAFLQGRRILDANKDPNNQHSLGELTAICNLPN